MDSCNLQPTEIFIDYEQGGLILEPVPDSVQKRFPEITYDNRTRQYRAPALIYRDLILAYRDLDPDVRLYDRARGYHQLNLDIKTSLRPRQHQEEALAAWVQAGQRGVISLPTGAGKTILSLFAIERIARSTLIVVPTIDLIHQWADVIATHLKENPGMIGGGCRDIRDITISTYDSAKILSEFLGNRFGLIIFDECHHLPAPGYQQIAWQSIAPFRIGLSATVERADGGEEQLHKLIGSFCYQGEIRDMANSVLSPYEVISVPVELTCEERTAYETSRKIYTDFLRRQGIDFRNQGGWAQFIIRAGRSREGRLAFQHYRLQKRLAQAAQGKLDEVWRLLNLHSGEHMIIFTEDNHMAYKIGRNFVLAVLTHKTRTKERKALLDAFRDGAIKVLVTSKVLNEGVDVPEARVGVVVSGSGAVREHVQRLGRLLRHQPGKHAILYEIVTQDTSEHHVNQRRRQHDAYQGAIAISDQKGDFNS